MKIKKVSCILLLMLFTINTMILVSTVDLGSDPENDLRRFTSDWLIDEFTDDFEDMVDYGDYDFIYDSLFEYWDDEDACEELTDSEKSDFDYLDIIDVDMDERDAHNMTLEVTVRGNAEDSLYFELVVWCDCSPSGDPFIIYLVSNSVTKVYYGFGSYDNDDFYDNIDFSNQGSKIMFDFPSDWYDEDAEGDLKVVMLGDDEDGDYYYIDLYPSVPVQASLGIWWWLIIILIVALIGIPIIYIVFKARKKIKS